MSDQVIGISVLDRMEKPERLYIRCQCADGHVLVTSIPIRRKGEPKTLANEWEYEEDGDTLRITPSLNILGTFHNAFNWSTKFVLFDEAKYLGHPGLQLKMENGESVKEQPQTPRHD